MPSLRIAVCVKQGLDAEAVVSLRSDGSIDRENQVLVLDPYCEFAVERAIQLKEENGGEVVVVAVGTQDALSAMRHALSMGADKGILIEVPDEPSVDPSSKASLLAAKLRTMELDAVMGGCRSADTAHAQVMSRVATNLGMPQVNIACALDLEADGVFSVTHETEDGRVVIEAPAPLVIAAQQGIAEPRYPTVRDIMQAKRKPIEICPAHEVDDGTTFGSSFTQVLRRRLKEPRAGGRIVSGPTNEAVGETVRLLHEEVKII